MLTSALLVQGGLKPDAAIHNSLMRLAFAEGATAKDLAQMLASLGGAHLQPDVHTYTLLLRAHGRQGDMDGAAEVMDQLQAAGRCLHMAVTTSRVESCALGFVWHMHADAEHSARVCMHPATAFAEQSHHEWACWAQRYCNLQQDTTLQTNVFGVTVAADFLQVWSG